ncbi:MAG: hypothetical protein U5Q16_02205 [Gammaproteobacteria bacterium]|nr:hypothetical protein [Gammaproteobacteria bacterium]
MVVAPMKNMTTYKRRRHPASHYEAERADRYTQGEHAGYDQAPVGMIGQSAYRELCQCTAGDSDGHHETNAAAVQAEGAAHQRPHRPERAGDQAAEECTKHRDPGSRARIAGEE